MTFLPLLDEPCTPSTPRPAPLLPCPAPSWGYYISSARAPGNLRPAPPRPGTGSFDLLVYTNADSSVPTNWEESDPRYINNSETVKLRSFTTKVHKVGAMVSYRVEN